jgi:hypothetical protein
MDTDGVADASSRTPNLAYVLPHCVCIAALAGIGFGVERMNASAMIMLCVVVAASLFLTDIGRPSSPIRTVGDIVRDGYCLSTSIGTGHQPEWLAGSGLARRICGDLRRTQKDRECFRQLDVEGHPVDLRCCIVDVGYCGIRNAEVWLTCQRESAAAVFRKTLRESGDRKWITSITAHRAQPKCRVRVRARYRPIRASQFNEIMGAIR